MSVLPRFVRSGRRVIPPSVEPARDEVTRIASTALALPEAYEEDAWAGVRWRTCTKTFAHILVAQEGYTSAYCSE